MLREGVGSSVDVLHECFAHVGDAKGLLQSVLCYAQHREVGIYPAEMVVAVSDEDGPCEFEGGDEGSELAREYFKYFWEDDENDVDFCREHLVDVPLVGCLLSRVAVGLLFQEEGSEFVAWFIQDGSVGYVGREAEIFCCVLHWS